MSMFAKKLTVENLEEIENLDTKSKVRAIFHFEIEKRISLTGEEKDLLNKMETGCVPASKKMGWEILDKKDEKKDDKKESVKNLVEEGKNLLATLNGLAKKVEANMEKEVGGLDKTPEKKETKKEKELRLLLEKIAAKDLDKQIVEAKKELGMS